MLKRNYFYFFCLVLFFHSVSFCEEGPKYSLKQGHPCRMSPKAPPKNLFYKSYKIYTYPGPWAVFDINGDGWCDWIRGGYEGYRTDEEDAMLKDFIYLGDPHGWRNYESLNRSKNITKYEVWTKRHDYLVGSSGAVSFYEPIPVYINDERKPYVVTAIRYDAPAPPPDYDRVLVTRWDDRQDALREVSAKEKEAIWNFLKKNLCNLPMDDYESSYGPRIIKRGSLCHENQ